MDKRKRATNSHLDIDYFKSESYLDDIETFLKAQIAGDLHGGRDITTASLGIENQNGKFIIVSKDTGIFCGGDEIKYFVENFYIDVNVKFLVKDGDSIQRDDVLAEISGSIGQIFIVERTMLNVLQRMSGIATITKKMIEFEGDKVLICPTRKTFLGSLDKKACMVGGGGTHRIGLSEAILFKKTHVNVMLRNFELMLKSAFNSNYPVKFIECEVESIEDAISVLSIYEKMTERASKQFVLMLDNIDSDEIRAFFKNISKDMKENVLFEASGGINEENLVDFSESGVDIISIGKITNGVRPLDFSFKVAK